MQKNKRIKILFFGNIPTTDKRSIGGATVLAKEILDFISKSDDLEVKHHQIRQFWRSKFQLIDYFIWIFYFPFVIRKYDIISFHVTDDFHQTVSPILWLWTKLFNKITVYHFFGGDFPLQYERQPGFLKKIWRKTFLRSDLLLMETKQMIKYFNQLGFNNIKWLPNSRKRMYQTPPDRTYNKRFVFISRVVPQKGVDVIVEAAKQLPDAYQLHLYGPIDNKYYSDNHFDSSIVAYKGIIAPENIEQVLNQYDVLMLPTFFEGEGYPGIIIEALSFGMPVITTHWRAIPEIIQDQYNGIVIPTNNSQALIEAINKLDTATYQKLSKNAFKSFENFDRDLVFSNVVAYYKEMMQ